jgi:Na+-transporting NADH:ubiquinone oxidoreductase subunit C
MAYSVVFAAVLATVCAALLTGARSLTRPYAEANEEHEKTRYLLEALEVPFDADAPRDEIRATYEINIRETAPDGLRRYAYVRGGATVAVAVPFGGAGMWDQVRGFVALEPDLRTIRRLVVYEQNETPSKGGQIAKGFFLDRFEGKSAYGPDGRPGIRLVRDSAGLARNEIQAISGATMTCSRLETMLNESLARLDEEEGR